MACKDVFEKTRSDSRVADLCTLQQLGAYPFCKECTPDQSLPPAEVRMHGQSVVTFGSNDYLALTRDPRVIEACMQASRRCGSGCSGSRLMNGTTELHLRLEEALADFLGRESALLYGTGFQANLGVMSALGGPRDLIAADEYCHASLVEGIRLSYARRARFRHNDLSSLAEVLEGCDPGIGRLVVIEGVYSMGGDLADIPGTAEVCRRYGARLFVDDAHGIGVLGPGGRGAVEHASAGAAVDLIGGTFSKAFASAGGFIAGERAVIDYLRHFSAPFVFSAAMPPASLAAASAALHIIRTEPERRKRTAELSAFCRECLARHGFDTNDCPTPLIALSIGDPRDERKAAAETGLFCNTLCQAGFYVNAVFGNAAAFPILRISIMASHDQDQIEALADAMARTAERLRVGPARQGA